VRALEAKLNGERWDPASWTPQEGAASRGQEPEQAEKGEWEYDWGDEGGRRERGRREAMGTRAGGGKEEGDEFTAAPSKESFASPLAVRQGLHVGAWPPLQVPQLRL